MAGGRVDMRLEKSTFYSSNHPRQSRGLSGLRPPQRELIAIQSQNLVEISAMTSPNLSYTITSNASVNVTLLLSPRQNRGITQFILNSSVVRTVNNEIIEKNNKLSNIMRSPDG
jgi:hypothetical protein